MATENISDLIVKSLSGNASAKEQKQLEILRQDPSNELIFKEMENIWRVSLIAKESIYPDTDLAWKKFRSSIMEEPEQKKRFSGKSVYFISAAAAVIPFIIFIFLFQPGKIALNNANTVAALPTQTIEENIPEVENILVNEVYTGDSIQEFILPDGTKIWLNKHSKFSYPEKFLEGERVVNLEGEAFFEVKKESNRPFIIYTPTSVTKVTGTSFNLKAYYGKEVEVVVASGSVEFSSLNKPFETKVVLSANQKASLDNQTNYTRKVENKVANYKKETTWRKSPKSEKRFKRFIKRIRNIFKRQDKDKH